MSIIGKIVVVFILVILVLLLVYHPSQFFALIELIWKGILWIAENGWELLKTVTGMVADKIPN